MAPWAGTRRQAAVVDEVRAARTTPSVDTGCRPRRADRRGRCPGKRRKRTGRGCTDGLWTGRDDWRALDVAARVAMMRPRIDLRDLLVVGTGFVDWESRLSARSPHSRSSATSSLVRLAPLDNSRPPAGCAWLNTPSWKCLRSLSSTPCSTSSLARTRHTYAVPAGLGVMSWGCAADSVPRHVAPDASWRAAQVVGCAPCYQWSSCTWATGPGASAAEGAGPSTCHGADPARGPGPRALFGDLDLARLFHMTRQGLTIEDYDRAINQTQPQGPDRHERLPRGHGQGRRRGR